MRPPLAPPPPSPRARRSGGRGLAGKPPTAGELGVRYSRRAAGARPTGSDARDRFEAVRRQSEALAANLTPEDQAIQSMPDVSPTKWHLAHTTWFFETFILARSTPPIGRSIRLTPICSIPITRRSGRAIRGPSAGCCRARRVDIVGAYREHVDAAMLRLIELAGQAAWARSAPLIELGLNHEQQHQELILMDIKHVFSINPLLPAYHAPRPQVRVDGAPPSRWDEFAGGLVEIGHRREGFAFDNEGPRHKVWLEPFRLASRPVTCGEYLEFIDDGGYRRPEFWLSDGWATVQRAGLGGAALLASRRRANGGLHAVRPAPGRSGRAGLPCQLLRGGRLCPLGRASGCRPRPNGRSPRPSMAPLAGNFADSGLYPSRAREAGGGRIGSCAR